MTRANLLLARQEPTRIEAVACGGRYVLDTCQSGLELLARIKSLMGKHVLSST